MESNQNSWIAEKYHHQSQILDQLGIQQWVHVGINLADIADLDVTENVLETDVSTHLNAKKTEFLLNNIQSNETKDAHDAFLETSNTTTEEDSKLNQETLLKSLRNESQSNESKSNEGLQHSKQVVHNNFDDDVHEKANTVKVTTNQANDINVNREQLVSLFNQTKQIELFALQGVFQKQPIFLIYTIELNAIKDNGLQSLWSNFLVAVRQNLGNIQANDTSFSFPILEQENTHTFENAIASIAGWLNAHTQKHDTPLKILCIGLQEASFTQNLIQYAINEFNLHANVHVLHGVQAMYDNWANKKHNWHLLVQ